jgi:hypothetical protein
MQKAFWLILVLTVFIFSWSKDKEEYVAPDLGYDYAGGRSW